MDEQKTVEQDLNALLARFYDELRVLARARLQRQLPPSDTLRATALVHEAYMKLLRKDKDPWDNHRYFFADMAQAMRDLIADYWKRKKSLKKGGHLMKIDPITTLPGGETIGAEQTVALLTALHRLQERFPVAADIVFLRNLGGYKMAEISDALGIPLRTVERKLQFGKANLRKELSGEPVEP